MKKILVNILGPIITFILRLNSGKQEFKADLVLYHFDTCPYCIKVRKKLKQLKIKIELKNIIKNKNHLQELINGGGNKMVPCLQTTENGSARWLYESEDIIQYLEGRFS